MDSVSSDTPARNPLAGDFVCEQCGKPFHRYPSSAKYGNPRFCSHPCHYAYFKAHDTLVRNPPVERVCEICGKTFKTRPTYPKRFCSQKCMLVWRGPIVREKRYEPDKHVQRACEWCGKTFECRTCWIKKGEGRFCCASCRAAYSAHVCQHKVSKVETRFADMLERAGLVFERHARIGSYAVDVYFAEARLIVEFDGTYWHSLQRTVAKDARKDAYAAAHGYRILHVPERTFYDAPETTLRMVLDALK